MTRSTNGTVHKGRKDEKTPCRLCPGRSVPWDGREFRGGAPEKPEAPSAGLPSSITLVPQGSASQESLHSAKNTSSLSWVELIIGPVLSKKRRDRKCLTTGLRSKRAARQAPGLNRRHRSRAQSCPPWPARRLSRAVQVTLVLLLAQMAERERAPRPCERASVVERRSRNESQMLRNR